MNRIEIYTPEQIKHIAAAGKIAAQTLDYIEPFVKTGISTLQLNDLCHNFIKKNGGKAAPLEVKGYKHAICTSVNDEICHGVPHKNIMLYDGDIINIDVTVNLNGYYGDTSRMYTVGKISDTAKDLIETTKLALMEAINVVKPNQPFSAIGKAIEKITKPKGYGIIRDFCGHGIGTMFHGAPHVFHFYHPEYDNVLMKEGMVFTIEPMINATPSITYFIDKKNKWTAFTQDGALSAQFEHTIVVTSKGAKILTRP
ncbi:MAG: type I methionyl aminopeptidase [Alphaproteobacteria bacterium]|nr:type I methionyl aminopeptidase [Alphaproteobacteria bacterium]MBN2780066.1 type I methionyl aminopeptidase [Alphaproteobacteria bacterium]